MDRNGVLATVFDPANTQLNVTEVGAASAMSTGQQGKLDENGVWAKVFDPATNTLRVVTA